MELPDHPRVREIEAKRRRRPIGINCAINLLRNGARHVIPCPNADPNGKGSRRDFPYFGSVPFQVHRAKGKPDTVQVSLLDEASVLNPFGGGPSPLTLLEFGFIALFNWQYNDGSGWSDFWQGSFPNIGIPGNGQLLNYDVNGSNFAVDGVPKLADTPIRPVQDYPTDPAWEAGWLANAVDTDYRITEVRFFFGNAVAPTFPLDVPNATGTWNIVWDERPDDVGFPDTTTITATHTVGTFQMVGTEDPTDSTTWPVINPSLSWSILSTEQIWFNGLRIERVS
jgi:hypothetical protein